MLDGYKIRDWKYLLLRGRETIAEHRQISNYTSQSGVNNDILIKLIGITKLLIIVATFILSPVFIYSLISIVTNRDVLINSNKYKKVNVVVDSIIDINSEGSTDGEIYGFSKELDNYKTEIIFGTIMDDDYPEKLGLDSLKKRVVWFRKGKRWAYPANSKDRYFPIRGFFYKKIKTSLIFLVLMFLTIYFFKQIDKKPDRSDM